MKNHRIAALLAAAAVAVSMTASPVHAKETTSQTSQTSSVTTVKSTDRYVYNKLSSAEKTFYDRLKECIQNRGKAAKVPEGMKGNSYERVISLLFYNEPQLFWFNGPVILKNGAAYPVYYELSDSDIARMQKEIDAKTAEVLKNVKKYKNTVTRVQYIHDWVITHNTMADMNEAFIKYNKTSPLWSALCSKDPLTADGYTMAMQYLCDKAGIQCLTTEGYFDFTAWGMEKDSNVAFCKVKIGNAWYNSVPSMDEDIGTTLPFAPDYVSHAYSCVPDEWLGIYNVDYTTYHYDDGSSAYIKLVDTPACKYKSMDYFVVNKKYFSTKENVQKYIKNETKKFIKSGKKQTNIQFRFSKPAFKTYGDFYNAAGKAIADVDSDIVFDLYGSTDNTPISAGQEVWISISQPGL